jgi:prepilin-type N-terminal cleavage/methylation domain-containing protein
LKRKKYIIAIKKNGFTLIEVILVVVIICVLYTIATPKYSKSYHNLLLRETGEVIVSKLEYAREISVLSNRIIIFVIQKDKKIIFLKDIENNQRLGKIKLNPEGILKMDKKYIVDSSSYEIRFFPTGECDSYEIEISDEENRLLIESIATSGKAKITME